MTQLSTLAVVESHTANPSLPSAVQALQTKAQSALGNIVVPTRRTEHWKYSAKRLGDLNALNAITAASRDTSPTLAAHGISNAIEINIVNGAIDASQLEAISSNTAGLSATTFANLSDEQISEVTELASYERGELEQLNTALFQDGIVLRIAKNTVIEQPIVINIQQDSPSFSTPRIFITVEQSAQATVVEQYNLADIEGLFCASQTTAIIGNNAKLTSLRMNPLGSAFRIGGTTRALLKRDSNFESHALCLGSAMARHDLHVLMTEKGAHCDLNGVVVTKEQQHFDNHTEIEHIASHCTSEENYRCIADDKSHIVFNGRIYIHKDAQKTLGEMNNRNLLLSNTAAIDTKPELEIYADDVKCAHGATIGQLDEKEVYYLKTRGLTDEQARQMLTLGFVLELVRGAPISELAEQWEDTLSELLSFQD